MVQLVMQMTETCMWTWARNESGTARWPQNEIINVIIGADTHNPESMDRKDMNWILFFQIFQSKPRRFINVNGDETW